MRLREHVVQAAVTSAIASLFIGLAENAMLFLSIIFIDVDHYFDFALVCWRYGVRDMFKFHDWLWKNHRNAIYGLSVFHTVEVFAAVFLLGFITHYFWVVFAGFLMHMFFDLIFLYYHGVFHNRAFSIIEYWVRRRNPSSKRGYCVPDANFWGQGG